MVRHSVATVLGLAALGLAACNQNRPGEGVNAKLCADFKQRTAPAVGASEGAAAVDECVKRWGYALAGSGDDADIVAEAASTACGAALSRWNQQIIAQPGADTETASLTTGQPTNPLAEHNNFMHRRALFYVVQARAGRCASPPIVNGAPEGVVG
jgi:hypothetical protein